MKSIRIAAASLGLCLTAMVSTSVASPMTGHSITAYFAQPDVDTPYSGVCGNNAPGCFSPNSFTVGSGVETHFVVGQNIASFDFTDSTLTIKWLVGSAGSYGTPFQGFVFTNSTAQFESVAAVTGNMGLSTSSVTVASNRLFVDLGALGLSRAAGDETVVTFGSTAVNVPEPGSLGLAALGLLAAMRCRRAANRCS